MTQDEIDKLRAYYDGNDTSEEMQDAQVVRGSLADPNVSTSVRMPWSIMKAVRLAAVRRKMKPTALMREWIEAGLADEMGEEATVPVTILRSAIAEYLASRRTA
jgi:hypothetical protein